MPVEQPQLQMVWLPDKPIKFIEPNTAQGYAIRTYEPSDEDSFLSLLEAGGFDQWDEEKLQFNLAKIIPNGWFFAVDMRSGKLVGTVMCLHNYTGNAPFTGDIGWLVCDPVHRGHALGYSLSAHATNRFLGAGYTQIQLHTEHYRLPAVKTYLRLGYLPLLSSQAIYDLWQDVCKRTGWEFTPDRWPRGQ